jgi:hypothetical protein
MTAAEPTFVGAERFSAQATVITPGGWTQASLGQAAEMGESYQRLRRDVASGVI